MGIHLVSITDIPAVNSLYINLYRAMLLFLWAQFPGVGLLSILDKQCQTEFWVTFHQWHMRVPCVHISIRINMIASFKWQQYDGYKVISHRYFKLRLPSSELQILNKCDWPFGSVLLTITAKSFCALLIGLFFLIGFKLLNCSFLIRYFF